MMATEVQGKPLDPCSTLVEVAEFLLFCDVLGSIDQVPFPLRITVRSSMICAPIPATRAQPKKVV